MGKKILKYFIILACIPAVIFLGAFIFSEKQYAWVSIAVALLSCVPFFAAFEKGRSGTQKMIILAVMTALSVVGRFAFSFLPHFKPVTAIVVICGMYLGGEAGFLCGALSALISNFMFGQGPWTPFQMFAWGILGLIAALLSKLLKKSKIVLCIYGVLAGAFYSVIMDVWSTLWADGTFNILRFGANLVSAFPVTIIYMASNAVFLLLLAKPMGNKLERITVKYGIYQKKA